MTQPTAMATASDTSAGHATEQTKQYLVFPLDDEDFGLNINSIREIIEYEDITEVPMVVPDFIRGVLNLRGSVLPVIDLQCRFIGE